MAVKSQFLLLLWKNFVLQKRRPIATVVEILLPLLFAALLIIIRTQVSITVYNSTTTWPEFSVDGMPKFPSSALPPNDTFKIGYVPMNDSSVENIVKNAVTILNKFPKTSIEEKCDVSLEELESMLSRAGRMDQSQFQLTDILRGFAGASSRNISGSSESTAMPPGMAGVPPQMPGMSPGMAGAAPNQNALLQQMLVMQQIQRKIECAMGALQKEIMSNIPAAYLNSTDDGNSTLEGTEEFANATRSQFNMTSMNFTTMLKYVNISPRLSAVGFESEEAMISYFENDTALATYFGGIIFTKNTEADYEYTIRLHADPINVEKSNIPAFSPIADTWKTHQLFPSFQRPGPREGNDRYGGKPGYYKEGFLSLMHAIHRSIYLTFVNETSDDLDDRVTMNRFPYPPYRFDNFLEAIQGMLPLTVLLSFFYTALSITKSIVNEKETQMKEYMMMMGLSNWLHWTAWFIKYLIFMMISCVGITILYKIQTPEGAVLTYSDGTVIFLYLTLYSAATIAFCFMLSVFFTKANVAAAGGGVIFGLSYMPYLFINPRYDQLSYLEKSLSCLLSNVAMANGVQILSNFESQGVGIQWYNFAHGVTVDDAFSMLNVCLFLLLDTIIYMKIAWYVEAVFPGEYGIPKPWYFFAQKSYWFGYTPKKVDIDEEAELSVNSLSGEDNQFFEEAPPGVKKVVNVKDLKKIFKANGKTKVAVNGLNMDMYEGQITVLLGHNGAGKTTTMSILTGLFPPSSGNASVMGYDITTDMQSARKSMGLCPQHNVLFDQLTVDEHVYFFSRLKGLSPEEATNECEKMADILQLKDKRNQLSSTLSGGMKRKLSVGIALSADSKFIVLDEPTAGMDPAARRAIWDVLQTYSRSCSMLLSTHFMDEADLLGDRIAIMADGKLRCVGSSVFLKNKFGVGYHVVLTTSPNRDIAKITELFTSNVPDAKYERAAGAELSFLLPFSASNHFPNLFNEIDANKNNLGIQSYGASITTMEEVFLSVTEDANESVAVVSKRRLSATGITPEHKPEKKKEEPLGSPYDHLEPLLNYDSTSVAAASARYGRLNTGVRLWFQQFFGLLIKKIIHSKRNYKVIIAQLLVPALFVILAVINAQNSPLLEKNKKLDLLLTKYGKTIVNYKVEESSNGLCTDIDCIYPQQFGRLADTHNVSSAFDSLEEYLSHKYETEGGGFNFKNVIAAEFKKQNGSRPERSIAWFNGQGYHTTANSLLYMDQAYLRSKLNSSNLTISVSNFPLERNATYQVQEQLVGSISGFMISFNLVLGFSFVMASFSLFLVRERIDKAALLQRLAGVDPFCFWLSTFVWDLINFLIPCILTIIVFAVMGMTEYIEDGNIWITALILFLFCWSSLPLTYLLSFLFSVPSTALVTITVLTDITGIATVITINVLRILQEDDVVAVLDWIFLLLPQYCLGQGLSDFYTNNKMLSICKGDMKAICDFIGIDYQENLLAWEPYGVGRFVTFMAWEGVVLFVILMFIEFDVYGLMLKAISHVKNNIFGSGNVTVPDENNHNTTWILDSDVMDEQRRINDTPHDELLKTDLLFVKNMKKVYYGRKGEKRGAKLVAVNNISIGISDKQCFGLLGINGAGKTTTFKMLTGDIRPTSGEAFLAGYNIFGSTKKAQQLMGYCPQFDALIDQMTGAETLRMYGRLRGIPEKSMDDEIQVLSKMLTLQDHIDKPCGTYSGGNKRKLSVAISLIGNPAVVLLDEPSTGMDPGARRMLWDAISNICSQGRCVVITSHNMEECEALCTRLAIMVNGEFKCLGGPQHLKHKFGEGYSAEIKLNAGIVENSPVKEYFEINFPGSTITDEHQGILAYHIPSSLPDNSMLSLAKIFQVMEDAKNTTELNIQDYSVSQTTLEQVFLGFAKRQRESSEAEA